MPLLRDSRYPGGLARQRRVTTRRQTMPIPFSVPSLALPGKVAIITGGGTGMGRSMALEFAKAGADIVVASRTVANIEQVAAEVRALGRRALPIRTDVSKRNHRSGPQRGLRRLRLASSQMRLCLLSI